MTHVKLDLLGMIGVWRRFISPTYSKKKCYESWLYRLSVALPSANAKKMSLIYAAKRWLSSDRLAMEVARVLYLPIGEGGFAASAL
jgi:hypothetical protein